MPDEAPEDPKPARRPRLKPQAVRKPPEKGYGGLIAGVAVTLTLGAGVVFTLISASMSGTRGARASTRLMWEQNQAEVNRIADQAEADGKLRKP